MNGSPVATHAARRIGRKVTPCGPSRALVLAPVGCMVVGSSLTRPEASLLAMAASTGPLNDPGSASHRKPTRDGWKNAAPWV
jgi:hypothetical protein